ncbi:hypothetical protein [Sandaracinobacteroides hominis]|uniref:hypothetical protein n=1 Tax=Sandaracinobacteroides hominis TaxID=2780086 RepID=UPI0018F42706|nr:hypothetical protein [Sandaracinobacteroides hominis]
MIAVAALTQLAARLTEALHHPVALGASSPEEQPRLTLLVHSIAPVPDVVKSTGRHLADQQTSLSWIIHLLLKGEAEGLLAQVRLIEAAAADIDGRPVLGGEGWRADMVLEGEPDWAKGVGPAIGVRLRVAAA